MGQRQQRFQDARGRCRGVPKCPRRTTAAFNNTSIPTTQPSSLQEPPLVVAELLSNAVGVRTSDKLVFHGHSSGKSFRPIRRPICRAGLSLACIGCVRRTRVFRSAAEQQRRSAAARTNRSGGVQRRDTIAGNARGPACALALSKDREKLRYP